MYYIMLVKTNYAKNYFSTINQSLPIRHLVFRPPPPPPPLSLLETKKVFMTITAVVANNTYY